MKRQGVSFFDECISSGQKLIYLCLIKFATVQIILVGWGGGCWGVILLLYIRTLPSHQYNLECCKKSWTKIYVELLIFYLNLIYKSRAVNFLFLSTVCYLQPFATVRSTRLILLAFTFQVLKAASPVLMRIILLGAFLLYLPVSIQ